MKVCCHVFFNTLAFFCGCARRIYVARTAVGRITDSHTMRPWPGRASTEAASPWRHRVPWPTTRLGHVFYAPYLRFFARTRMIAVDVLYVVCISTFEWLDHACLFAPIRLAFTCQNSFPCRFSCRLLLTGPGSLSHCLSNVLPVASRPVELQLTSR